MRIRVLLEQNGKTAVGFAVPEATVVALGKGRRPPVRVTINGHTYRSTVAPMGGRFLIGVSAENRAAAGVAGGQRSTSTSSSIRRRARSTYRRTSPPPSTATRWHAGRSTPSPRATSATTCPW